MFDITPLEVVFLTASRGFYIGRKKSVRGRW